MRLKGSIVLVALTVSAAPLLAQGMPSMLPHSGVLSPSARAAAASVDAFHAALRRGDTRAASAFLADDALIYESGGVERSKAEYAAHHLPADAEFSRSVPTVVKRRAGRSDGGLAWITTEGRTAGTYQGKEVDLLTTETMVLRRTGGTWKIVHIHWSSQRSH